MSLALTKDPEPPEIGRHAKVADDSGRLFSPAPPPFRVPHRPERWRVYSEYVHAMTGGRLAYDPEPERSMPRPPVQLNGESHFMNQPPDARDARAFSRRGHGIDLWYLRCPRGHSIPSTVDGMLQLQKNASFGRQLCDDCDALGAMRPRPDLGRMIDEAAACLPPELTRIIEDYLPLEQILLSCRETIAAASSRENAPGYLKLLNWLSSRPAEEWLLYIPTSPVDLYKFYMNYGMQINDYCAPQLLDLIQLYKYDEKTFGKCLPRLAAGYARLRQYLCFRALRLGSVTSQVCGEWLHAQISITRDKYISGRDFDSTIQLCVGIHPVSYYADERHDIARAIRGVWCFAKYVYDRLRPEDQAAVVADYVRWCQGCGVRAIDA